MSSDEIKQIAKEFWISVKEEVLEARKAALTGNSSWKGETILEPIYSYEQGVGVLNFSEIVADKTSKDRY